MTDEAMDELERLLREQWAAMNRGKIRKPEGAEAAAPAGTPKGILAGSYEDGARRLAKHLNLPFEGGDE